MATTKKRPLKKKNPSKYTGKQTTLDPRRSVFIYDKFLNWFETAFKNISEDGADVLSHPERIFNCDETRFRLCSTSAEVVPREAEAYQVEKDSSSYISILACGSAVGEIHQPLIIFPVQRFRYDPVSGFPEAHFSRSSDAKINEDIFEHWLKTAFIPAVDHLEKPVVLFVDHSKTSMGLSTYELCRSNKIILYCLSKQIYSYFVQPLNIVYFTNFNMVWTEEVRKFNERHENYPSIRDFSTLFKKAWDLSVKKDFVVAGFANAGIYPWDPDNVVLVEPSELSKPTRRIISSKSAGMAQLDNGIIVKSEPEEQSSEPLPDPFQAQMIPISANEEIVIDDQKHIILECDQNEVVIECVQHDETETVENGDDAVYSDCYSVTLEPESSVPFQPLPLPPTTPTTQANCAPGVITACSPSHELSPVVMFDRILDLAAKSGLERLVHLRTLHDMNVQSCNAEEQLFCLFYKKLTELVSNTGNTSKRHANLSSESVLDKSTVPSHSSSSSSSGSSSSSSSSSSNSRKSNKKRKIT